MLEVLEQVQEAFQLQSLNNKVRVVQAVLELVLEVLQNQDNKFLEELVVPEVVQQSVNLHLEELVLPVQPVPGKCNREHRECCLCDEIREWHCYSLKHRSTLPGRSSWVVHYQRLSGHEMLNNTHTHTHTPHLLIGFISEGRW